MSAPGGLAGREAGRAPAPWSAQDGGDARVQAPFGRRLLAVTGMEELGAYRVLRVADPGGPAPQPGQFAMLAAAEGWGAGEDERPFLPRAFSVARWRGGEAHYLLEDVGPGTHRLCELRTGDGVWVLGPLGVGFTPPDSGVDPERDPGADPDPPHRAILVGGGVGIAPLAIWQDALREAATVLLGFRDGARAQGAGLLHDARVATDDGSVGHHGLVTDLLAVELDRDAHATVYACGPAPMLEATRALCAARGVPAQLALESGMACGFGACFGCVVPVRGGGYARVCVEGPVFDSARLEHIDAHAGSPA